MADSAVVTELQLTDAPASAPNNLRCNGSSLMYVSKNAVALVEDAGGDASSFRPRASGYGSKASTVDAATWVPTPAGSVIVVMTGGRDISFYRDCINDASADEEHGAATGTAQMLFSYTLKSNAASANGTTLRVMDGATCAAAVMSADDSCLVRQKHEHSHPESETWGALRAKRGGRGRGRGPRHVLCAQHSAPALASHLSVPCVYAGNGITITRRTHVAADLFFH